MFLDPKFFLTKNSFWVKEFIRNQIFFRPNIFFKTLGPQKDQIKQNLANQTYQIKRPNKTEQKEPSEQNLPHHVYRTKPIKLNLPTQTYHTKPKQTMSVNLSKKRNYLKPKLARAWQNSA